MASFSTTRRVEFAHCDPAGIVFYPRYFDMLSSVVEEWFDRVIGWNYRDMHLRDRLGVPAVHIDVDFQTPSPLGDDLDFELRVERLGASSLRLRITAHCAGTQRLASTLVVVQMQLDERRPVVWTADVRKRIEALGEVAGGLPR